MFPKVMRVHYIRIEVTWNQNSFYKSATASRAWPLPGAFLIPPALLGVADFIVKFGVFLEIGTQIQCIPRADKSDF
jgi:hypothetical protein